MSPMSMSMTPTRRGPTAAATDAKSCPLGSSCSCVFQRIGPTDTKPAGSPAPSGATSDSTPASRLLIEVEAWTDRGWVVVETRNDEVRLERRRALAFCVNVLLSVATGFLWVPYWAYRSRRPRIERVLVSVTAVGTVEAALR